MANDEKELETSTVGDRATWSSSSKPALRQEWSGAGGEPPLGEGGGMVFGFMFLGGIFCKKIDTFKLLWKPHFGGMSHKHVIFVKRKL